MKKELKEEIASAARDILQPLFIGLLQNQDDTLLAKGGSNGLKIYDDIERDAFAHAVINKRKMAVVSYPWEVDPASESTRDKKAAELVKAQLSAFNFDKLTLDMLDAVLKGYSVSEVMWAQDGREIYIEQVIPRNQRRFVFDEDRRLRMLTMSDMLKGIDLPERKFIVHSVGAKDGSPYGLGLGSKLYWPTFFKRQNITFWLTFADKFGNPTAIGKYPAGTQETDQQALLESLRAISQESAIAVPDTMILELLEAQRSGAGDLYERMCRYMDEQISVAVLGETLTTVAKNTGLGSGQSDVQNDIRMELARADADLLTGTLQNSLVRWIVELNLPGAGIPRVWRKIEAQEDLNVRSERDERIAGLGFKPTLDYITETYGEGWEPAEPTTPITAKQPQIEPGHEFAEGDLFPDQQALDVAIGAINGEEIDAHMHALVKPLLDAIDHAEPSQVLDSLLNKYPDMDSAQLEEVMARAYFVAEIWGRLNA